MQASRITEMLQKESNKVTDLVREINEKDKTISEKLEEIERLESLYHSELNKRDEVNQQQATEITNMIKIREALESQMDSEILKREKIIMTQKDQVKTLTQSTTRLKDQLSVHQRVNQGNRFIPNHSATLDDMMSRSNAYSPVICRPPPSPPLPSDVEEQPH